MARSSTVAAKVDLLTLLCSLLSIFMKSRKMLCFTLLFNLLRPEYMLTPHLFFFPFPSTKYFSTFAFLPLPHSVVLSRPHNFLHLPNTEVVSMKVAVSRTSWGLSDFKKKLSKREEKYFLSPEWPNRIYSLGQQNNPQRCRKFPVLVMNILRFHELSFLLGAVLANKQSSVTFWVTAQFNLVGHFFALVFQTTNNLKALIKTKPNQTK